jgi:NADPH:quinone reductase-like Zn-dependent oxidoreductase
VTGVCSTANIDLVRSLGADIVIDYRQVDFTQLDEQYDLIFDIVANRSVRDYMRVLTPTGHYVACAFNPTVLFLGSFYSRKDGKQARSLSHQVNPVDLAVMRDLIEAGKVSPVVDRCFPLEGTADAMRYLGSKQQRGKVVIRVATNGE